MSARTGWRALGAFVAAVCAAASPARAEAPAWQVDLAESRVTFEARQMGVPVPGRFGRFTAEVRFSPDDPASGRVEIEIDVASVTTPNQDIETEIKREPWFDVARFPSARFVAETFHKTGDGSYDVDGRLTLRGVTRPVVLPATIRIAPDAADPALLRAEAKGEVVVRRTDFGIGQGQWREPGIVADEVVIRIHIRAHRRAP